MNSSFSRSRFLYCQMVFPFSSTTDSSSLILAQFSQISFSNSTTVSSNLDCCSENNQQFKSMSFLLQTRSLLCCVEMSAILSFNQLMTTNRFQQCVQLLPLLMDCKLRRGCGWISKWARWEISDITYTMQLLFIRQPSLQQLNKQQNMGCIDSQPEPAPVTTQPQRQRTPKSSSKKPNRLVTNVRYEQIKQISDAERKAGAKPVYRCPICTLGFNKILACEECNNCICHNCYLTYEKKAKRNFRCSFCQSETSVFRDYDQQAHSYFDTTGQNGFLNAEQRNKVDEELQRAKGQNSRLQPIQQVEAS